MRAWVSQVFYYTFQMGEGRYESWMSQFETQEVSIDPKMAHTHCIVYTPFSKSILHSKHAWNVYFPGLSQHAWVEDKKSERGGGAGSYGRLIVFGSLVQVPLLGVDLSK